MSFDESTDDGKGSAAKQAATLARQVEANDIKWLMADPRGRRIVRRLIGEAGVYRSSFTGNSETFFREGLRQSGLNLISIVTRDAPEDYMRMLTEGLKA